ncbi:MAG: sulfotransferase [Candidatus Marinimicrobia bacterium]|nr:sulfotransferase [Candidatus Neomarinimicrobiota bacterium]
MKVDFIILGAAKCGTTTLYRILKDHPDINFCREKEPDFFSKTEDWKTHLADYHKLFREEEGKIYGEASHSYTAYPRFNLNIWEDIHAYNPGMKFIYIVRDPVDRFISSYMQDYQRGGSAFPSVRRSIRDGRLCAPGITPRSSPLSIPSGGKRS